MEVDRHTSTRLVQHVAEVYKEFAARYELTHGEVFLSSLHLLLAIDSAVIDIKRMTDFHFGHDPTKTPDRHKYAGFVSKWIAKTRPIQFSRNQPPNLSNSQKLELNAAFAVNVMMSFLRYPIPTTMAFHLKYWFGFRDERGETLALVAYSCEEMTRKGPSA